MNKIIYMHIINNKQYNNHFLVNRIIWLLEVIIIILIKNRVITINNSKYKNV